ncbi:hypothetical protein G6F42_020628 [Rhizopus arrhizus]|nr:hypothetical protein G6F42_020628 [Rhizopus arrhizus]
MSFPEPLPSISTPLQSTSDLRTEINHRPRRHTITRPDSAMALLSDMEDDGDDEEQQQTFDRISNILNSLIQEANDAVHGIEHERVQLLSANANKKASKTPRVFTSSTIITQHHHHSPLDSKIPRPKKSRSSIHQRNSSASSSASSSSNSIFSPVSAASTSATLSRSPSPTLANFKKQLFRHTALRPRSCPVIQPPRRSMTPRSKRNSLVAATDPIMESFKRLDTSMALVDSLSRDLATQKVKDNNKIILLLLVPLLHIPHSLITMIFDFCSSNSSINSSKPTSSFISSLILWACVFAATNLMVDQVSVTPTKKSLVQKVRRMSIPGSFNQNNTKKPTVEKKKTVVASVKRTWIPATVQQQQQPLPELRRRKSI